VTYVDPSGRTPTPAPGTGGESKAGDFSDQGVKSDVRLDRDIDKFFENLNKDIERDLADLRREMERPYLESRVMREFDPNSNSSPVTKSVLDSFSQAFKNAPRVDVTFNPNAQQSPVANPNQQGGGTKAFQDAVTSYGQSLIKEYLERELVSPLLEQLGLKGSASAASSSTGSTGSAPAGGAAQKAETSSPGTWSTTGSLEPGKIGLGVTYRGEFTFEAGVRHSLTETAGTVQFKMDW
jgi:hypothetical protein